MSKKISLNDLKLQEQEVREQIKAQGKKISQTLENVFEPLKPSKILSVNLSRLLNNSFIFYKGITLGYKIINHFGLFDRKKKR